jgi:hypothetical protein
LCSLRCEYTSRKPLLDISKILSRLDQAFAKLVLLTLRKELQQLLIRIKTPTESEQSVLAILAVLVELGNQQSTEINLLLADLKVTDHLVNLIRTSSVLPIRLLALRALSSVCCTVECIRGLEQSNGVEIIASLLTASLSLEERMEAAGVLAQVTSPWISDNHRVEGLTQHVPSMVATLTVLAQLHCGDDNLLLVSAALANLSFMETSSIKCMKRLSTVRTLLDRMQASPFSSVFARDQVVTVMANVAADSDGREDVKEDDSMEFLAGQLLCRIEDVDSSAEQAAVERILKKSAIALCRVCQEENICVKLEALGVVERAEELCKCPSTRNYSDSVLVACLALLRRVGSFLPHSVDQSLLQESLVDSFRELSTHQESYV